MNIWNLTKKDLAVILKDRGAVLWLFVLPVVFTVLFSGLASLAYGGSSDETEDTRIPIVVVNLDAGSSQSELFLKMLDSAGGYRVELSDEAAAEQSLLDLKISRYLVIPAGFGADLAQGKQVTVLVPTHPDASLSGTESVMQVLNGAAKDMSLELQLLDGIRQMGSMQTDPASGETAFETEKVLAQAKGQFDRSRTIPLIAVAQSEVLKEKEEAIAGFDLSKSIIPGMTVLFVFLAASIVAHNIYQERKEGSLRRLLASPLSRSDLLLGKMLPIWLLTLVQIVVIFLVGGILLPLLGFGRLGVGSNWLAWAITSMIIALCSTSLGIMIYAIARTEAQITGLSNALLWVAGFLGGALIPSFLIAQIPVLNILSRLVPQSYATQAYYDILAKGASLVDVLPQLGMLLLFTAVFFFVGVRRFRFE